MVKGLVISAALTLICFFTQIAISLFFRPRRIFPVLMFLFVGSIPFYLGLYLKTPPSLYILPHKFALTSVRLGFVNGLWIYFLFYCSYIQCYYYVTRPVTLRILEEFVKAPGGYLTIPEIQSVYGLTHMIRSRLDTLVLNGYVTEQNRRYFVTPKGKIFAQVFLAIRSIFSIRYYVDANNP